MEKKTKKNLTTDEKIVVCLKYALEKGNADILFRVSEVIQKRAVFERSVDNYIREIDTR